MLNLSRKEDVIDIELFDTIGDLTNSGDDDVITGAKMANEITNLKGDEKINFYINSDGGSIPDTIMIFNALKDHAGEVTTIVNGLAASAASWLIQAGDNRVMYENSIWMSHKPMAFIMLQALNSNDMREAADVLDVLQSTIANMYAKRSGLSLDQANALMEKETYLNAQQVKELNLIDRIIEKKDDLNYSPAVNKYDVPDWFNKMIKDTQPEESNSDLGLEFDYLMNSIGL